MIDSKCIMCGCYTVYPKRENKKRYACAYCKLEWDKPTKNKLF